MVKEIMYCDRCASKFKLPTSAIVKIGTCVLCKTDTILVQIVPYEKVKDKVELMVGLAALLIKYPDCDPEIVNKLDAVYDHVKAKSGEKEAGIIVEKLLVGAVKKEYTIEKLISLADKFIMARNIFKK